MLFNLIVTNAEHERLAHAITQFTTRTTRWRDFLRRHGVTDDEHSALMSRR